MYDHSSCTRPLQTLVHGHEETQAGQATPGALQGRGGAFPSPAEGQWAAALSALWHQPQLPQPACSLCSDTSVKSDSLWPHGWWLSRLLCPRESAGKNTAVGCCFLLQGIFLTQESNLHLTGRFFFFFAVTFYFIYIYFFFPQLFLLVGGGRQVL